MKKFLILIFAWFAGCYTVIKHPSIDYTDSSGEVYTSHVSYRSNCSSCHSPSELSYFYSFIPSHDSSPWVYYNTPWWIQWSNNSIDTGQATVSSPPQEERLRDFGVHRGSNTNSTSFSPPTPTRSPSVTGNNASSSSSGSMEKERSSKNSKSGDSVRTRTSDDDSKSQGKEESKDGKRNIGSRRK